MNADELGLIKKSKLIYMFQLYRYTVVVLTCSVRENCENHLLLLNNIFLRVLGNENTIVQLLLVA